MKTRYGYLKKLPTEDPVILIIFIIVTISISGCAVFKRPPAPVEMTPATRKLLSRLFLENAGLQTFKGIGTVRIGFPGKNRRTARIAWIGAFSDKLRISVLNAGGLPTATVATDGTHLFMTSHAPKKSVTSKGSNPSLDRLIGIDIHTRDVIQILGGRVPIRDFDAAEAKRNAETGNLTLTLFNRRGRAVEKIHMSEDGMRPASAEILDSSGKLMVRVSFSQFREIDGFSIPFSIVIESPDGLLLLQVHRYWPQAEIAPSAFTLGSSGMRRGPCLICTG